MAKAKESYDDMIDRMHRDACDKGRKAYRDPLTKCRVCTSDFLQSRGVCCRCDCRHCPFPEGQRDRMAAAAQGVAPQIA